jgi:hypothetical protein
LRFQHPQQNLREKKKAGQYGGLDPLPAIQAQNCTFVHDPSFANPYYSLKQDTDQQQSPNSGAMETANATDLDPH